MGRNNIPKLGEWRNGSKYHFTTVKAFSDKKKLPVASENGAMICYLREFYDNDGKVQTELIACAYADGLQELLAAFYRQGFDKGRIAGHAEAKREIRQALGVVS